ncbi:MAG: hypothetical protein ACP5O3_01100 [Candidatus Micrarchaeia archaeon]
MDNASKFYLLLVCGLAFASVSAFAEPLLAFAGFAAFLVAAIALSKRFKEAELNDAWKLLALTAVMAALMFNARLLSRAGAFAVAVALAVVVAAFTAFKLLASRNAVGRVVGRRRGFVLVETTRSLLSPLPPGVYAVKSTARHREGEKVELRVSKGLFGPPKPVEVLSCKKKE